MKIVEAQRHASRLRTLSRIVLFVSSIFLLFCGLKTIAWQFYGDTSAFAPISNAILRFVRFVYEHTQFLSWFWQLAPVANPRQLNSTGNYGVLFIVCCFVLGVVMRDSANLLSRRIKKTLLHVEEFGWTQTLMAQQGLTPGQQPNVLQINIDLQQEDQWYKRPFGLIVLGIVIAVLGQWANLKFGLVK